MSRVCGVIGGMGPAATVDFMARVIARTPAVTDQDHVRMIVDCNPGLPDRNAAVAGLGPSPALQLAQMAGGLQTAGADFLVMPCNAAHAFADAVRAATPLPFIDMIGATRDEILALTPVPTRIGVLASTGCLDAELYPRAFAGTGIDVIVPEGAARTAFMNILYRIKAGETGPEIRAMMAAIAAALVEEGADAIVAGCTEVPLVLDQADLAPPLVNTSDVLADRVIAEALHSRSPQEIRSS